jgi:Lar family restriction alleviation protein
VEEKAFSDFYMGWMGVNIQEFSEDCKLRRDALTLAVASAAWAAAKDYFSPSSLAIASMKELKPCPFCGGVAVFVWISYIGAPKPTGYAKCSRCKAETQHASPESAARLLWNTRIAPPSGGEG